MDYTQLYNQLVSDFNLEGLSEEDRDEMLFEVTKTIQKQFLMDVYDILGKDQFDALQKSAEMGEDFYATTLKHVLPTYEEVFQKARQKVVTAFNGRNEGVVE
jgi:hypothetical protein